MADSTPSTLDYASPGVRTAKSPLPPLSPRTRRIIALASILGLCCLAMAAYLCWDTCIDDASSELTQISILRPGFVALPPVLWAAGALMLWSSTIVLFIRKRVRSGIMVLIVGALAGVISLATGLEGWKNRAIIHDRIVLPDGSEYCLLKREHNWLGQELLTKTKQTRFLRHAMDVLGSSGNSMYVSWHLLVVRPMPRPSGASQLLYVTPGGLVVALRDGNVCIMAYDATNRCFYAARNDIRKLSPFLLLDDQSQLDPADEAAILAAIRRCDRSHYGATGLPTPESLTEALIHRNPAVRLSAVRMLTAEVAAGIVKP